MSLKIVHKDLGTAAEGSDDDKPLKAKKSLGIKDLPAELRDTYSQLVSTRYIEHIGQSADPWFSPGCEVIQGIFDDAYDGISCEITRGTAPHDVASFLFISITTYNR